MERHRTRGGEVIKASLHLQYMDSIRYAKRLFLGGLVGALWLLYVDFNALFLHPINWTNIMLRLPFTSWDFYRTLLSAIQSVPYLEKILANVYVLGYIFSFVFAVVYFILIRRPEEVDGVMMGFAVTLIIAGTVYAFAYVQPPHIVYGVNPVQSKYMKLANNRFVFPSLHAAFATFLALYFWKRAKHVIVKLIYAIIGIITPINIVVLVQHWIYDAFAGILLGWFAFVVVEKHSKRITDMVEEWKARKTTIWILTIIIYLVTIAYSAAKMGIIA